MRGIRSGSFFLRGLIFGEGRGSAGPFLPTPRSGARRNYWGGGQSRCSTKLLGRGKTKISPQNRDANAFALAYRGIFIYIVMKRHQRCHFKNFLGKIAFLRHSSLELTIFRKIFRRY